MDNQDPVRHVRGTKPGTKFTKKHRRNMSRARRRSAAVKEVYAKMAEDFKGRRPTDQAITASLATRALRRIGLTRHDAPDLWAHYRDLFLARLSRRAEHASD